MLVNKLWTRGKIDMNEYRDYIPLLATANHVVKVKKGFSFDQKYVVDDQYLIRIFSNKDNARRKIEFDTIHQLGAYSSYVPKAIEYGTLLETKEDYMILTYFPGEDAEVALPNLTDEEQYQAGFTAGVELNKLHEFPAPSETPTWYEQKKRKSEYYMEQLQLMEVDNKLKGLLFSYIRDHMDLMLGQPNRFQHDDFHPANLLINQKKFAGIIDFQRMDWGDPVHDLHKLGFFSSRISIPFTRGIVDGYHSDTGLGNFWELYTLYSAMHVVSALVWGERMGNFNKMFAYSMDVVRDHEHFNQVIPKWY